MRSLNQTTAVDTKDHLLRLLRDKGVEAVADVLSVLRATRGMWVELNYAYKGSEICNIAADLVLDELWNCSHWRRKQTLDTLHSDAINLSEEFHALQQTVCMVR